MDDDIRLSFAQKGKEFWICEKEGYTKYTCPDCDKKEETEEWPDEKDSNMNKGGNTKVINGVVGLNCATKSEVEEGGFCQ